ncbi:hypothetical protein [Thermomonas sp. LB-4]|jgi:hypothetical protein|uniref:hypothetical protein n=1 Tax=Thermomonas sp. LB-4 TaxID=3102790 RepID=UPI002EDB7290
MRLPTTRQLLVCLALSGAFGHAGASELRQLTPESAPQTDPQPASMERLDETDLDVTAAAAAHAPRTPRPRAQAPGPARTAGDSRAMPSRFHSFLPGMFR